MTSDTKKVYRVYAAKDGVFRRILRVDDANDELDLDDDEICLGIVEVHPDVSIPYDDPVFTRKSPMPRGRK